MKKFRVIKQFNLLLDHPRQPLEVIAKVGDRVWLDGKHLYLEDRSNGEKQLAVGRWPWFEECIEEEK